MRDAYHNEDPFNQPTMAFCEAKMNVWLREQEQLAADGSGTWPFQAGAKLRDLHSQVDHGRLLTAGRRNVTWRMMLTKLRTRLICFHSMMKMKIE
jgi:hypothetical protein